MARLKEIVGFMYRKNLVNEKLTFCMHFPIPTADLDSLRDVLQEWRIRCPGSAAVGLANVATGRLDGCLEFRSKPWDCAAGMPYAKEPVPGFTSLEILLSQ